MIRIYIFLIALINILIPSAFCQIAPDNNNTLQISLFEKAAFKNHYLKSAKNIGSNYDLKYHRFNWYINPEVRFIKGNVTSYFLTTADNVTNISFELSDSLMVDSIMNNSNKLTFLHIDNVLNIDLKKNLSVNNIDSITIYYSGVPPVDTVYYSSFVQEMTNETNASPIIWTLSEPYGSRDWWPCKQTLNDKIDSIDIFVTTPKQFRVAGNGLLVSEKTIANDKIFHWKHRYPIAAYLIAIAVTRYAVYSDWVDLPEGKKLEILNYVYKEDSADLRKETALSADFIKLFSKLFTPYPFLNEKYGHAQFNWKGGMEHQTMSFMGYFQFEITSHELAHQWFGNAVTTGSWQDIWINEGFATYLTGLCYEHMFPDHYYWNLWKYLKIKNITSKPYGSVFVNDTSDIGNIFNQRLTYNKAAMLLHGLRWIMGDSNFYLAVRNFLNDKKIYHGYALNSDLKYHLEAASGIDLTWFFNDWYYGEGYPIYNISVARNIDNTLLVTLNQTTSHSSVNFFKLPVPLLFKNQYNDTIIVFNNTFSGQTFNLNLNFFPDTVIFDPDRWLIAKSNMNITLIDNQVVSPENFVVSPNPANDFCYIYFSGFKVEKIVIADITGKTIETDLCISNGNIPVNLGNLNKGIYLLKAFTDKGIINRKILKL